MVKDYHTITYNVVVKYAYYVYANEDRHYRRKKTFNEKGVYTYVSMVKDYHNGTKNVVV